MTFILFIVLLSVIIILHEGGHLIAAKTFGVYCSEFSIGMGPKIVSHKGKETEYSLRALPIGGFVAMAGDTDNRLETQTDVEVPPERTLTGIAKWKRIVIMLAGIFMNFVLGYVIITLILLHSGGYVLSPKAEIAAVSPGTPAAAAGLLAGDRITAVQIEGGSLQKLSSFDDLVMYLATYEGEGDVLFTVERNGETLSFSIVPEYSEESGRYLIGISGPQGEVAKINFGNVWGYAFDYCAYMVRSIWMSLRQLLHGIGTSNMSGPVGIYQATGQAAAAGASSYFLMMALISINIGFMNLLPLPILDGGRVLLTLIEALIRRPLSEKAQSFLMTLSTALVLMLFVYVTFNDVLRLLP
ncbi:MAG: RIP metalloprotease RseP [Erysipelotrichaceae bacterium]|nr:RIP metalloprotease RseP [Erysipelotrichaceae bacterium]